MRQRLARAITGTHARTTDGELRALVLDPRAEELFRGGRGSDRRRSRRLTGALEDAARARRRARRRRVLVVAPDVRRAVSAVAPVTSPVSRSCPTARSTQDPLVTRAMTRGSGPPPPAQGAS